MKNCRRIEPLLYLYRDKELSADDRKKVLEHTRDCRDCRAILGQLVSIDKVLGEMRKIVPDLSSDSVLINETMKIISEGATHGLPDQKSAPLLDDIVFWLRPALRVILFAAVLTVVLQASRDAFKVADLEHRLREHGNAAASATAMTPSGGLQLSDLASLQGERRGPFSRRSGTPAIAGDPMRLLAPGLMELVRHKTGLFDDIARRYPNLPTITLEDGLDDREREILATEGKEFMKEFEKLLLEGEK